MYNFKGFEAVLPPANIQCELTLGGCKLPIKNAKLWKQTVKVSCGKATSD